MVELDLILDEVIQEFPEPEGTSVLAIAWAREVTRRVVMVAVTHEPLVKALCNLARSEGYEQGWADAGGLP